MCQAWLKEQSFNGSVFFNIARPPAETRPVLLLLVRGNPENGWRRDRTTVWMVPKPVVNNGINQLPTSTGERRISGPPTVFFKHMYAIGPSLNSHCFPMLRDGKINHIVGVYVQIVIKGGRSPIPNICFFFFQK